MLLRQCCQRSASRKTTFGFPFTSTPTSPRLSPTVVKSASEVFEGRKLTDGHSSHVILPQVGSCYSPSCTFRFQEQRWELCSVASRPASRLSPPDPDTVTIRTTPVVLSLSSTSPPPPVIGHCFPSSRSESGNEIYRFQISGGGRVKAGEGWHDPL